MESFPGSTVEIRSGAIFALEENAKTGIPDLSFALQRARKIVRGLKERLTRDERDAVADHVVAQLKERGDPCD